jgi:adenine/guanine phosphoribosyltransferase-like PRPP-binding protein
LTDDAGADMGLNINWGDLRWERRGDRIADHRIAHVRGESALLLDCPDWIRDQIAMIYGTDCEPRTPAERVADDFNHAFRFPGGAPDDLASTVELLSTVLSIPAPPHVDVAITLDWYTQPDDAGGLKHTPAGYWINTTKHAPHPEWSNSRNSRRLMINALVDMIRIHPLYANATAIIAAPGHLADGQSFGEVLARDVAARVGIPFVETTAPGPREQQKEGATQDLTEVFTVQGALSGDVIVLDDVYRTGGSASGAAAAAKRAGADRVLSVAVARTIRW